MVQTKRSHLYYNTLFLASISLVPLGTLLSMVLLQKQWKAWPDIAYINYFSCTTNNCDKKIITSLENSTSNEIYIIKAAYNQPCMPLEIILNFVHFPTPKQSSLFSEDKHYTFLTSASSSYLAVVSCLIMLWIHYVHMNAM